MLNNKYTTIINPSLSAPWCRSLILFYSIWHFPYFICVSVSLTRLPILSLDCVLVTRHQTLISFSWQGVSFRSKVRTGWWWLGEGSWPSSGITILITGIRSSLNQPGHRAQTFSSSHTPLCLSSAQSLSQTSSLSSLLVCPFFIPDAPSANVKTTVDVISPGVRGLRRALCRATAVHRPDKAESLTQKTRHLPGLS